MRFEFFTPTKIVFGQGVFGEIGGIAKSMGSRALVVGGASAPDAGPVLALAGVACVPFLTSGEPTTTLVREGTEKARSEHCNFVIGIGGGSSIDAAKAIAALLTNSGDLLDYLEVIGSGKSLAHPSAPCLAVPTTAGTGAEVTRNAVLASPEHHVKVSLRSPFMTPKVALIDPKLTVSMPPAVTAFTGMDALTQVIEPFVCARANPVTDSLCREGITRAARSLRRAFADGKNLDAREDMCVTSLFGGLALANSGLGAVHGFAAPMGGMFSAPHGALCAALLPWVMEANIRALHDKRQLERFDEVAGILTGRAKAVEAVEWLLQLTADLKIPRLRSWGVSKDRFDEIILAASKASSMKANPTTLSREDLAKILDAAL